METSDLSIYTFGDAEQPPLVLLHGLTEAGTTWPNALAHWEADWYIVAVDQRGHGHSPRFTPEQLDNVGQCVLADTLTVLEALSQPAVIVGHSMGGAIGALAAHARPDLVRALVLEDPAHPLSPQELQSAEVQAGLAAFRAENLEFLNRFRDGIGPEIARMRRETNWSDAEIAAWAESKLLVDEAMIQAAHLELARGETWEGLLNSLEVPTVLIVPMDGPTDPPAGAITSDLVRVVRVPNVGHCIRRDDPDAYHRTVDSFLAALA